MCLNNNIISPVNFMETAVLLTREMNADCSHVGNPFKVSNAGFEEEDDVAWEEESYNVADWSVMTTGDEQEVTREADMEPGSIELEMGDEDSMRPLTPTSDKKRKADAIRYTVDDRDVSIQRHKEDLMSALLDLQRVTSRVSGDSSLLAVVASLLPMTLLTPNTQNSAPSAEQIKVILTHFRRITSHLSVIGSNSKLGHFFKRKYKRAETDPFINNPAMQHLEPETLLQLITATGSQTHVSVYQLALLLTCVCICCEVRVRLVFGVAACSCLPQKHGDIATHRRKICLQEKERQQEVKRSKLADIPSGTTDAIAEIMKDNRKQALGFNIPVTFRKLNKESETFIHNDTSPQEATEDADLDVEDNDDVIDVDSVDFTRPVDESLPASVLSGREGFIDRSREHQDVIMNCWLEVCVSNPQLPQGSARTSKPSPTAVVDLTDDDDDLIEIFEPTSSVMHSPYEWIVIDPITLDICEYPLLALNSLQLQPSRKDTTVAVNTNVFNGSYSYAFAASPQLSSHAPHHMRSSSSSSSSTRMAGFIEDNSAVGLGVRDLSWKYVPNVEGLMCVGDRRLSWDMHNNWLIPTLQKQFHSDDGTRRSLSNDNYWNWDEVADDFSSYNKLMELNLLSLPNSVGAHHLKQAAFSHMTIASLKYHPRFVLERYLAVDEIIVHPDLLRQQAVIDLSGPKPPLIQCTLANKSNEAVYLRSHVSKLKPRLKWLKEEHRSVKLGEKPVRVLKRKRYSGGPRSSSASTSEIEVKLYGKWQTEPMQVPVVRDGIIPTNSYGNIEVWEGDEYFVPQGCVLFENPESSSSGGNGGITVKVACQLGLYHAPAVYGFLFNSNSQKMVPQIGGIVVLSRDAGLMQEALTSYHEHILEQQHQKAETKARKEKQKVLEKWAHLVQALWTKERLAELYGFSNKGKL